MSTDLTLFDVPARGSEGETSIHPTAIVAKGAQLGVGVVIGPYSIIGPEAILHDGVRIGSHCTVENRTTIGARTAVHAFCSLGVYPQDLKFERDETSLVIGEENSIRQYCNFSIGTAGGGGQTVVGRRNLFMVYTHIAHDCIVEDNCVFANGVSLGGHVTVGEHAVVGGHAAIHQFCRIGQRAMLAGGAMVVQDVPPFCMVHGDRAAPSGLNVVGLRRMGVSAQDMKAIKAMYRLLYQENLTLEDSIRRIAEEVPPSSYREAFVEFLRSSERGVCR